MTGQPSKRQPRSGHAVKTASHKATRQIAFAQLRAEALAARGTAFALLAMQYGQKLAAAQQQLRGPALEAALKAIMAEQRAAEQALGAKLKAEDAARRKAVGKEFTAKARGQTTTRSVQFRAAAAEATGRRIDRPNRPRERQRSTRAPRLRR